MGGYQEYFSHYLELLHVGLQMRMPVLTTEPLIPITHRAVYSMSMFMYEGGRYSSAGLSACKSKIPLTIT